MADTQTAAAGVQELISRLRDEGVQTGQQEAERIAREAREQAAQIVAQAQSEAEEILARAHAEIESNRAAAKEELKLAVRDTQLSLQSEVRARFADHVRRLVTMELQDRDFLQKVILAIVGAATAHLPEDQRVELLMPSELFVSDHEGEELTEHGKGRLRRLILAISAEMLREGVELNPCGGIDAGFRVQLVGEDLEIDLTDKALADVMLKHLTPRLKVISRGME
jgi:V/A-type H+-transporting ATPase subunit E